MGYKDVVEACAQTLLTRASLIGSRTNSGKILCILAEELRNGLWEKVADVEGIDWQDRPVPLLLPGFSLTGSPCYPPTRGIRAFRVP